MVACAAISVDRESRNTLTFCSFHTLTVVCLNEKFGSSSILCIDISPTSRRLEAAARGQVFVWAGCAMRHDANDESDDDDDDNDNGSGGAVRLPGNCSSVDCNATCSAHQPGVKR